MRVALLCSLFTLLIGCSSNDQPVLVDNGPAAEQSWQDLGLARYSAHVQAVRADKRAPAQHAQLAIAVAGVVDQCARRARSGRAWSDPLKMQSAFSEAELSCVRELINQTLVVSGPDRAYEASLAARSSDPKWFQSVLPSHILVD